MENPVKIAHRGETSKGYPCYCLIRYRIQDELVAAIGFFYLSRRDLALVVYTYEKHKIEQVFNGDVATEVERIVSALVECARREKEYENEAVVEVETNDLWLCTVLRERMAGEQKC